MLGGRGTIGRWSVWCALVALGIAAPVFGQSDPDAGDPAVGEAREQPQPTQGILPVPDYSGDFWARPALTGDWGGTRQKWADNGFTFELNWYQVGQGIVSGGRDTGWAYGTNLDYYLKLDLMRMNLVPGALVTLRGQSRFGKTVNADSGLLLPVNTYSFFPLTSKIDDDVPLAITELNWLQLFSEEMGLLLGQVTTMSSSNEFAGGEGKSQFMNFQFMYSAVLAQVVPYSTLAVGGVWMPSPDLNVSSILMNLTDSSTTSGFGDIGDGTAWATTIDGRYRLGGLPGGTTAGFIYAFDAEFAEIGGLNIDPGGGVSLDTKSSSFAFYLSSWQYLFTEESPEAVDPTNGRQDLEGVGLFAILGIGDRDANPVTWSIALGVSGRGSIPGRDADTWGVGYFYNDLQELRTIPVDALAGSVQGIEAYYNIAIAESVALTLDFQWADSAVRGIDDSIIPGLRLNLTF